MFDAKTVKRTLEACGMILKLIVGMLFGLFIATDFSVGHGTLVIVAMVAIGMAAAEIESWDPVTSE